MRGNLEEDIEELPKVNMVKAHKEIKKSQKEQHVRLKRKRDRTKGWARHKFQRNQQSISDGDEDQWTRKVGAELEIIPKKHVGVEDGIIPNASFSNIKKRAILTNHC